MYFATILYSKWRNFGSSAIRFLISILRNYLFWKDWITDNKCLIIDKMDKAYQIWFLYVPSAYIQDSCRPFSLVLPGNLESNMHIMSDVSNTFQLWRWSIFSSSTKKFCIFWYASVSTALIWDQCLVSFLQAVMIL